MKAFVEMKKPLCTSRRCRLILNLALLLPCLRVVRNDSNVDDHIVLKILVSRNKCVPTVVLKADAVRRTLVKAVKILDSGYNRVGGIVRKYLHPHWQSCPMVGGTIEQQLECDVLRRRTDGGDTVACWGIVAVTLTDGRGSKALTVEGHVIGHDRVTCRVLMQPLCLLGCSLCRMLRARRPLGFVG